MNIKKIGMDNVKNILNLVGLKKKGKKVIKKKMRRLKF